MLEEKKEIRSILLDLFDQMERNCLPKDRFDLHMTERVASLIQAETSLIDPCTREEAEKTGYYGHLWGYAIKISPNPNPEFKLKDLLFFSQE